MRARPHGALSLLLSVALFGALALPTGTAFADPASPTAPAITADPADSPGSPFLADPLAPSVPGELVVVLDSAETVTTSERALEARGAEVERIHGDPGSLLVTVPQGMSQPLFTELARSAPGVAWVQPNYIYRIAMVPNDPKYPQQWALPKIGASTAWDTTRGKSSVVVAVVDTGVDYRHPDLVGRVDTTNDHDFVEDDDDAMDDADPTDDEQLGWGHGTHVTGVIVATMNNKRGVAGVAPLCRVLPVKVMDNKGEGDTADVAAGIRYAADHGAKVISLSLEGPAADSSLRRAIAYAQGRGCVVVAAAGNHWEPSGAAYPARYAGVVGVGAADRSNRRAWFSNYGPGVDIAAPGEEILSTVPDGGYQSVTLDGHPWSGTSMATPFVSGVAALVISANPTMGPADVIRRILDTATPLTSAGLGAGLVNAARAVLPTSGSYDDDIPGIPAAQHIEGSFASGPDTHDVYKIYLNAAQTFDATMAETSSGEADLLLFGPDATHVAGAQPSTPLTFALAESQPQVLHYANASHRAGWYYLDVRRKSTDTGSYAVDWVRGSSSDADLPGTSAQSAQLTGTVDALDDADDVFAVHLAADELLSVELHGSDPAADIGVALYDADALSIFVDLPTAESTAVASVERLRYRAPKEGTYYLRVEARTGSGDYTLDWLAAPYVSTDNIPGAEPTSSPVAGAVGGLGGTDDVYRVYLQARQTLDLTMTTAGSDASGYPWLSLYSLAAVDVDADDDLTVRTNHWSSATKATSYTAQLSGYYYIDLYSLGAPTAYQLQWHASSDLDGTASGAIGLGDSAEGTLGWVTDPDDVYRFSARAGERISASLAPKTATGPDFDLYLYGPDSAELSTPIAEASGTAYPKSVGFDVEEDGVYYLRAHATAGSGSYRLTRSLRATMGTPSAASEVAHGHAFTVYGYVAPKHSGAAPVSVRFYLRDSHGVYVYHHTLKTRLYDSGSVTASKYRVRASLAHAGRWRVRAVHSDATHAASYSAYHYITAS